ncbi:hypothetical protein niasHS_009686 [Heterodera schachtii]|uniref:RING-type domain-containing protein n=2 Tax=Heterodera TaxID=34509 RepID=A0ABD2J3C5_HETSC
MGLFRFCLRSALSTLFLLLNLFFLPTVQDTLLCGSTSYELSLDPTRPSTGGRANGGIGGIGSSMAMPTSSGAKYQFVRMNVLMRNVCDLVPEQLTPDVVSSRLVITRCEECSKCPQKLPSIQRMLSQISLDASIQSLLVILVKDFESARGIARLAQQDPTVKFVFLEDDDLDSPTVCELTDSNDGSSLKDADSLKSFSKTSVLFVSISFIILMVISLAWLVFYYVQRFRYAHAKDRLQRRLFNAAKKALARIPTRPVKAGDKELNSDCPVCIDPYRQGDICRQLPCRHIFHKSCVDPWLLEHRTCPMCKSDILKAFGYHVCNGRRRAQFSAGMEEDGASGDHDMPRGDRLSLDANSTGSESANPFPVVTEVHDPFGFSPSASPQLIQMVQQSPRCIQIVPLTAASIERHSIGTESAADDHHEDGAVQQPLQQEPVGQHHQQPVQHSTSSGNQYTSVTVADSAAKGTKRPGTYAGAASSPGTANSGGALALFRAVTGRRHHVVNLVHVRSRSFSQSQEASGTAPDAAQRGESALRTVIPTSNSAIYGFGNGSTDAAAIIYSTDNRGGTGGEASPGGANNGGDGTAAAAKIKGGNLEIALEGGNLSRARTAPSGFRRKIVANAAATHRTATGGGHWWSQRGKTGPKSHETRTADGAEGAK